VIAFDTWVSKTRKIRPRDWEIALKHCGLVKDMVLTLLVLAIDYWYKAQAAPNTQAEQNPSDDNNNNQVFVGHRMVHLLGVKKLADVSFFLLLFYNLYAIFRVSSVSPSNHRTGTRRSIGKTTKNHSITTREPWKRNGSNGSFSYLPM
jgi:hypothetical protein